MEKIIRDNPLTKVVYDTEKRTYTKYLYPKFDKKIKYFFRLRKYPGENYKYITDIFNKKGIKTAEIINFSKYSVETREIEGIELYKKMIDCSKEEGERLIHTYIDIVIKIINLGVYFGDFNFENFMVSENDIYAIDLEDYRKDLFSRYRKKSLLKRLKRCLTERTKVRGTMLLYYDGEKIYNEIYKNIKF